MSSFCAPIPPSAGSLSIQPRPCRAGGRCDFFEHPSPTGAPLGVWRASADPRVLIGHARRAGPDETDALDFRRLDLGLTVFTERPGVERVVISDGPRRLRLELRGASVLDGPVRLHIRVALASLDQRVAALRRLAGLVRAGRLPASLYPPDPVVARRALALAAWDAAWAGDSQRRIIGEVLGETLVPGDLVDERRFDSLRMRVARLIAHAEARIDAGARRFLSER